MSSFVNLELLSPLNALVVIMVLIFGAYAAMLLYNNAGTFVPHLPSP